MINPRIATEWHVVRHVVMACAMVLALAAVASAEVSAEPRRPKPTASDAQPKRAQIADCAKFQNWTYGQECRRDDGKVCQVMDQRANPSELKFCK